MCCSSFRLLFVFGRCGKLYILRCNISYFIICLLLDILYVCRTQIQKVKKHDRHTHNHPTHKLGAFHNLPRMVRNISKMPRIHHF